MRCDGYGEGEIMLTRRRIVIVVVAFLSCAAFLILTVIFYRNPFDPLDSGRQPVDGEYVRQTKESITGRFGPPSHEWEGYYGNPPLDYANAHSPSITTTYIRFTGTLFLSFEQVDAEWICYCSDWMPNGWVF